MIITGQAQFLITACMAFQLKQSRVEFSILIQPPLKLSKHDSSIGRINRLIIQSTQNCHGYIQALCRAKHMTVVKMILFHCLDNVNVFFASEYAYFVASEDKHED